MQHLIEPHLAGTETCSAPSPSQGEALAFGVCAIQGAGPTVCPPFSVSDAAPFSLAACWHQEKWCLAPLVSFWDCECSQHIAESPVLFSSAFC